MFDDYDVSAPDINSLLSFVPVDEIDTNNELFRLDAIDDAYRTVNSFGYGRLRRNANA